MLLKIQNSLVALSFLTMLSSSAQNLVVNSTFEGKHIRKSYSELIKAHAWQNANNGTADLFDKNKSGKINAPNGIPANYMGYQESGDGQNYAGIVAYYDDGTNDYDSPKANNFLFTLNRNNGYKRYTEYIEGEFREPMIAGSVYQVSFRVNLADRSGRAVSCIGALITADKVQQENNTFLSQTPQFISHRVISDTSNWVILSGAYIAAGGEKFITIGCFKDESFLVEKVVGDFQNDSRKAYYYIAEVSVVPYLTPGRSMESVITGVDYVELMNVQFSSGNSEVLPQFYPELDEVAAWMTRFPDYKFFVAGYADQQGTRTVNDPLSLERAKNVKKYLVEKGVNENAIVTEGYGSSDPIENKMKSSKNRRVEIYLYSAKISQL